MGAPFIFNGRRAKGLTADGMLLSDGSKIDSDGLVNYIKNGHAEVNTTGWATYADAAASRPVDGTGGSPTVTWTRSTSSPLRGQASFLLTKDAANRQGEGASYAFTIDSADQAKVLNISFDWAVASGTYSGGSSSTDSDLIVYIYDVTNSRLIEPAPIKLDGAVVGTNYKYVSSFQSSSNSTSYRLIVHCATTSASAYTVKFDNVAVGPSVVTTGAFISDWQSFTPTGAWSTNTTYTGKWRRVGDTMEVEAYVSVSGAPTSATLTVNLPSGYTIDTTKLGITIANREPLGYGLVDDTGTGIYPLTVAYNSSSSVVVMAHNASSTYAAGNNVNATTPITFASGDGVTINFQVPIVGWGTSQALSSETDTRVVAAKLTKSGTQAFSSETKITSFATSFDTHGAWDSTNHRYVFPLAGHYKININYNSTPGTTATQTPAYKIDGGSTVYFGAGSNGSATARVSGTDLINVRAGQYLEVYLFTNASVTVQATETYITIERLSGPSQVAASESVSVLYTGDGSGLLDIKTSGTKFQYDTKVIDTHSAWSTSSDLFTAPVSGVYQFSGYNPISGASSTDLTNATIALVCSDSTKSQTVSNGISSVGNSTTSAHLVYSTLIYLKAGETVSLQNAFTTTTLNQDRTAARSRIAIHRVGN